MNLNKVEFTPELSVIEQVGYSIVQHDISIKCSLVYFFTGVVPYDSSDSYLQFWFDNSCEYLRKCTTWRPWLIEHACNLCVFHHFLLQSVKCTKNNHELWLFRTKSLSWLNSTKSRKWQKLRKDQPRDTFGIHVQGTVLLQCYDKERGEFVSVEIKDLNNRDKISHDFGKLLADQKTA